MSRVKGKQIDTDFPTDVHCPELYADVKHFRIPHPAKPGTDLVYSSLEGPENGVYCRGIGKTGEVVKWPTHFGSIINPESVTVQLTPIGDPTAVSVAEMLGSGFVAATQAETPTCFFWHAYAERSDIPVLQVERPARTKKEQAPKRRSFALWFFSLFG